MGILGLLHKDVETAAESLLMHLHINPDRHLSHAFINAATRMTDAGLWVSLQDLAEIIAESMSIHAAATELLENETWDFGGFFISRLDARGDLLKTALQSGTVPASGRRTTGRPT